MTLTSQSRPSFTTDRLGGLQLHQLRTMDALYQERSVTAAALRLNLTPSAVSHHLHKLRDMLGDELFRRTPQGMEPTERTVALIAPIREALGILNHAFDRSKFDPHNSNRRFRIGCLLSLRMALGPMLAAELERDGSGVSFDLRQIHDGFESELEAERLDLAIATVDRTAPGFESCLLRHEEVVVAIRADHPRGAGPLSLAELAELRHVDIRATDFYRSGAPQQTLEQFELASALSVHGLTPQICMIVPDTVSALEIIKRTDMIALCPRRIAEAYGGDAIRLLTPPYQPNSTPVRLLWTVKRDRDEGLRWLRQRVIAALAPPLDGG